MTDRQDKKIMGSMIHDNDNYQTNLTCTQEVCASVSSQPPPPIFQNQMRFVIICQSIVFVFKINLRLKVNVRLCKQIDAIHLYALQAENILCRRCALMP